MSDLTLAQFLLERLAETASTAERYHRLLCLRIACDADDCIWGADEQEAMERERVCNCGYPQSIRDDVEAKRRIVELHQECTDCTPWGNRPDEPCDSLVALALPYSDHPDYNEDWKP